MVWLAEGAVASPCREGQNTSLPAISRSFITMSKPLISGNEKTPNTGTREIMLKPLSNIAYWHDYFFKMLDGPSCQKTFSVVFSD
jgi:hypothetical protein